MATTPEQTAIVRVGSILHGAYGDYYEQLVCLKHYRRQNPNIRLVLFFASPHRWKEMRVFDLSFAEEVHPASTLENVPVDQFLQFQGRDPELRQDILNRLPPALRSKVEQCDNLKPWTWLRRMDLRDPINDVPLSAEGRARLPDCMHENGIDPAVFDNRFTVGFLWRYRRAGGAISPRLQAPEEEVVRTKRELFGRLIDQYGAQVFVCGMNVRRTDENFYRIEAKYTERDLGLGGQGVTYLKGLSWGLELEILRRCSLCLVMPSGFSEALWMKRSGPTLLLDAPPHYLAKLLWHRMPIFDTLGLADFVFQSRQPHTADRVLARLRAKQLLPASPTPAAAVGYA